MTRWHSSVSVCVLACAAVLQTINPPCSSPAVAGSPWHNVVRRTTNDRDEDLIRSLLLLRRFDDAETICREQIQRAVPTSDAAAKWAIRWSSVMTERQISKEQFDDADVSQAEQPVVELLSGYPNHRRKLFLQAQRVSVQHAAARHDVVIAAVSPANEKRTEAVFTRLARVTQRYRELATQVDAERAATDAGPTSLDQKNRSAELTRLQHELQVDIVSMALMQTELFPPDSRDQIASASKAEQAAADALLDLPTGSQAQKEIERLRIQAMILAGKLDQAGPSLVALIRASEQPTPPSLLAIQIQLHQLKNESSLAEKRLAEFYGSEPDEAPFSIEMDLVRLDHLIRQNDSSIGSWLTSIQRRNGDYARRRAEAISLAKLRSGGSSESIDPSIVAAQGKEWLRRDNPSRGGDLLAAAADAESDSQLALNYAMESAAALLKAQRVEDAASVLSRIAVAHPN
ncbi:MAG: hypothetical protein HKN47_18250, partial [Pirellulaceae bacterium]|nr:hypothetical protein [Pirellulaceae bacterium]